MGIEEAAGKQSQGAAVLAEGLQFQDLQSEITFKKYSRVVLPLDGYIFWMPSGVVLKVQGSLHHTQQIIQGETETLGLATVTFTALSEVTEFADTPIDTIWVAALGQLRYAFSSHGQFFQANKLWHYSGHSINPVMESQLLDTPGVLDPSRVVVSNSLPIWLSLNTYESPYVGGFSTGITLYPSEAVPANLPPPYGVVHIPPEQTRALQTIPLIKVIQKPLTAPVTDDAGNPVLGPNGLPVMFDVLDDSGQPIFVPTRVSSQLMSDRVHITLYGLQNTEAIDFLNSIIEYMTVSSDLGLMNMPALQDGKRQQVELQALAMQKFLDVEVSYQQSAAHAVALALIKKATITLYVPPDIVINPS